MFALLVQRGQAIVTRDEFLETVWDNDGSDEALTQAISRLRKILGDNTLIETVPRTGYRLAVLPHKSEDNEPLRSRPSKAVRFQSQNLTAINLGILLIMVGAAAFWLGTHSSGADDTQIELEIEKGPDSEFYKIPDQPS